MTIELTAGYSDLVRITAQGSEIAVNETPEFTAMFLIQQVLAPGSQITREYHTIEQSRLPKARVRVDQSRTHNGVREYSGLTKEGRRYTYGEASILERAFAAHEGIRVEVSNRNG